MVADRAYSLGLLASPDRRTSLLYFAAAVPTVGFVHGATDLNLINAAALEGYAETRLARATKRYGGSDLKALASGPPVACLRLWDLIAALGSHHGSLACGEHHGLNVSRHSAGAP
jgi:hypothetical protein